MRLKFSGVRLLPHMWLARCHAPAAPSMQACTPTIIDKHIPPPCRPPQMYALSAVLLLGLLNRLPLKLPQRGAGRRHRQQDTHSSVTFADVAGVDEAKEELQARACCCFR